jgi:hypothetical protein
MSAAAGRAPKVSMPNVRPRPETSVALNADRRDVENFIVVPLGCDGGWLFQPDNIASQHRTPAIAVIPVIRWLSHRPAREYGCHWNCAAGIDSSAIAIGRNSVQPAPM